MKLRLALGALVVMGLAVQACSTDDSPGKDSQTSNFTEGALGFAPKLDWGTTVAGQVAAPQIDIWALSVKAGDKFRVTKTVTGGDLKPDVVLFRGNASQHFSSSDFEAAQNTVRKDYAAEFDGTYFAVVRGYQNEGAGSYSLSVECTGGPCAGEVPPPPIVELRESEASFCVRTARECAIKKLPAYNGAVGPVRSKQLFDSCLAESTVETDESDVPASCSTACAGDDAAYVCDAIVGLLPWLADQSADCIDEYDMCVEECYDASWGDNDANVVNGGEGVCATGASAFNGSCPDVQQLQVCGGAWAGDSCEGCYIRCQQRTGAWIDDLDTICDEECECTPSEDFWY